MFNLINNVARPDKNGFFGRFGGAFIPENLQKEMLIKSPQTAVQQSAGEVISNRLFAFFFGGKRRKEKSLAKKKRRKGISPLRGRQGLCPLIPPPFEKGGRKLLLKGLCKSFSHRHRRSRAIKIMPLLSRACTSEGNGIIFVGSRQRRRGGGLHTPNF